MSMKPYPSDLMRAIRHARVLGLLDDEALAELEADERYQFTLDVEAEYRLDGPDDLDDEEVEP